jgi:hypothetical protein
MTGVVLICGDVFDGVSDALTGPAEILIEDNRISQVERQSASLDLFCRSDVGASSPPRSMTKSLVAAARQEDWIFTHMPTSIAPPARSPSRMPLFEVWVARLTRIAHVVLPRIPVTRDPSRFGLAKTSDPGQPMAGSSVSSSLNTIASLCVSSRAP